MSEHATSPGKALVQSLTDEVNWLRDEAALLDNAINDLAGIVELIRQCTAALDARTIEVSYEVMRAWFSKCVHEIEAATESVKRFGGQVRVPGQANAPLDQ